MKPNWGLSLALLCAAGAQGGIVRVTSAEDISYGLRIDWTSLGVDSDVLTRPVSTPISAAIVATVSLPSETDLVRADEGDSWLGDFSLGTPLVWTNWDPGPLRFEFDHPIQAFGLHIQPNVAGDPPLPSFTATMEAWNAVVSLGSISASGFSSWAEDGSALFLGFVSSGADVTRVDVSIIDEFSSPIDFAVDGPVGAETVPEPGVGWLAPLPAGAFLLLKRRRC